MSLQSVNLTKKYFYPYVKKWFDLLRAYVKMPRKYENGFTYSFFFTSHKLTMMMYCCNRLYQCLINFKRTIQTSFFRKGKEYLMSRNVEQTRINYPKEQSNKERDQETKIVEV